MTSALFIITTTMDANEFSKFILQIEKLRKLDCLKSVPLKRLLERLNNIRRSQLHCKLLNNTPISTSAVFPFLAAARSYSTYLIHKNDSLELFRICSTKLISNPCTPPLFVNGFAIL